MMDMISKFKTILSQYSNEVVEPQMLENLEYKRLYTECQAIQKEIAYLLDTGIENEYYSDFIEKFEELYSFIYNFAVVLGTLTMLENSAASLEEFSAILRENKQYINLCEMFCASEENFLKTLENQTKSDYMNLRRKYKGGFVRLILCVYNSVGAVARKFLTEYGI